MLYVSALDTLAGLRFHESASPQLSRQNHSRFVRFIAEYAAWADGDRVSLPFLADQLATLKLSSNPGIYVSERLKKFDPHDGGALPVSSVDELASALRSYATTEKEEDAIRRHQHVSLLYRYRNSLVHESREPGTAMEVFDSNAGAYYHGYIDDSKWYLAYPLTLFDGLLRRSLANFKTYLETNAIDPYGLVEDKARW